MIRIYHAPNTRSIRIIWLCEELGLPYTIEAIDFSPSFRHAPGYRRLNPVGKVPAIADGDFTMFESGAIVEYLLERYGQGRLRPVPGSEDSARYLQWSWFAEATFARPLGDIAQHTVVRPEAERIPAMVADGKARALLCLDAVDAAVSGRRFLVGASFSAADIMMGYTLFLARLFGVMTADSHAAANAYYDGLLQRPGFVKALA
ncbi:MAG: glutathione S-transferase family protein [Burkholderiales bacterium]|nr:glutathione S-transferase family protein [Burkholderiales bacterium]